MKKILVISFVLVLSLLLFACNQSGQVIQNNVKESSAPPVDAEDLEADLERAQEEETIIVEELEDLICLRNSDCEESLLCIDKQCRDINDYYDTKSECSVKCNFNEVVISTSDGDELTLARGQGSYTAAGAVEWKLLSSADYCMQDETVVAVKLIKKSLGQILEDEIITVKVGEESESIGHPTIASIDFTLTVESINEQCS